jgi:hypothetical protein
LAPAGPLAPVEPLPDPPGLPEGPDPPVPPEGPAEFVDPEGGAELLSPPLSLPPPPPPRSFPAATAPEGSIAAPARAAVAIPEPEAIDDTAGMIRLIRAGSATSATAMSVSPTITEMSPLPSSLKMLVPESLNAVAYTMAAAGL